MTYESAVASVWPAVASVGRSELRRLRLPADVVEDLVQDAAAVVMRRRPAFTSSDDLAPYVRVVVRRLAYRWLSRQTRELVGVVPDRPTAYSVPELAEQRLRLRGTVQAFEALPTQQRSHLREYLRAADRTGDARERARERKQIERIRMAMNRALEGLVAGLGWVRDRLRWFELTTPQAAAGVACVLTGMVALVAPFAHAEPEPSTIVSVSASLTQSSAPSAAPGASFGRTEFLAPSLDERRRSAPTNGTQPSGPRRTEVIAVDMPTGEGSAATWSTGESPNGGDLLACVGEACVNYSDLPVPIPHNGDALRQ